MFYFNHAEPLELGRNVEILDLLWAQLDETSSPIAIKSLKTQLCVSKMTYGESLHENDQFNV